MKMNKTLYWTVELITLIALLSNIMTFVIVAVSTVNAAAPLHYNFWGEVDSWGKKSVLLIIPVVAIFIYVAIFSSQYLIRFLAKKKTFSEQQIKILNNAIYLLLYDKLLVTIMFTFINITSLLIFWGKATQMNIFIELTLFASLILLNTIYVIKLYKMTKNVPPIQLF
jgi:hypothetical protein